MPILETGKKEKAVERSALKTVEPIVVANAILDYARFAGGENLTPMKLQKLLFLVHGGLLGSDIGRLRSGFEAWPYGPVNRDIYFLYRHYGRFEITENVTEVFGEPVPFLRSVELAKPVWYLIESAYDTFGSWTAGQLSDFTHKAGSPWHDAVTFFKNEERREPRALDGVIISDDQIARYFSSELLNAESKVMPFAK